MKRGIVLFVLYDWLFFFKLCFNLNLDGAVFGPRTFDCARPAPAITSFSPVGCAATACLGHARCSTANVKLLLVRQNIKALVEQTFFQELSRIGINMNWYGGKLNRCRVDVPTAPTPQTGVQMWRSFYFFFKRDPDRPLGTVIALQSPRHVTGTNYETAKLTRGDSFVNYHDPGRSDEERTDHEVQEQWGYRRLFANFLTLRLYAMVRQPI